MDGLQFYLYSPLSEISLENRESGVRSQESGEKNFHPLLVCAFLMGGLALFSVASKPRRGINSLPRVD
jgi:hypothetical protein